MSKDSLSPESKIWIYQSEIPFDAETEGIVESKCADFCKIWTAHNQQLKAGYRILFHHFIVLIVDETQNDASGCSIDKSVHFIQDLGKEIHRNLLDRMNMFYLLNEHVIPFHLLEIGTYHKQGMIHEDSLMVNTNISTLKQLDEQFLIPLKEHWAASRLNT